MRRFKVVYDDRRGGRWEIFVEHSSGLSWTPVTQNIDTKKEAVKEARKIAKSKAPSQLIIENMRGAISEETRYD